MPPGTHYGGDEALERRVDELEANVGGTEAALPNDDEPWVADFVGTTGGEFSLVFIGRYVDDYRDELIAFGSSIESAGDLAGIFARRDSEWVELGAAAADFNGFSNYGGQMYEGFMYVGDRRGGHLRRLKLNPDGTLLSYENPVAEVGDEDVFVGPTYRGKLVLSTFGSTDGDPQPPKTFVWDGSGLRLLKEFDDVGPGNYVSSHTVYEGEVWVTLASTLQAAVEDRFDGCRVWRLTENDATFVRAIPHEYHLAVWDGDLIALRSATCAPQVMVWDGGGFVPLSRPAPTGVGDARLLGIVGDELWASADGAVWCWSHDAGWKAIGTEITDENPGLLSTPVCFKEHLGAVYLTVNQPVKLYRKVLGAARLYRANTVQSGHGGRRADSTPAPHALAMPAAVEFPDTDEDVTSDPLTVAIENTGNEPLAVSATTLTGTHAADFDITAGDGAHTLEPGETFDLTVTFTPSAAGARTASLSVASDDADSPLLVPLGGTALAAAAGPVLDTFTDTSGTNLIAHTGESGATWTKHPSRAGDVLISPANRAYVLGAGTAWGYFASGIPATVEYDIICDYVFKDTDTQHELEIVGRYDTAADSCYAVRREEILSLWKLLVVNAGTTTVLGTFSNDPAVDAVVEVKLQIRNATKKVFLDGVEVISSADNTVAAKGRAGVRGFTLPGMTATTGIHYDNFAVEDA